MPPTSNTNGRKRQASPSTPTKLHHKKASRTGKQKDAVSKSSVEQPQRTRPMRTNAGQGGQVAQLERVFDNIRPDLGQKKKGPGNTTLFPDQTPENVLAPPPQAQRGPRAAQANANDGNTVPRPAIERSLSNSTAPVFHQNEPGSHFGFSTISNADRNAHPQGMQPPPQHPQSAQPQSMQPLNSHTPNLQHAHPQNSQPQSQDTHHMSHMPSSTHFNAHHGHSQASHFPNNGDPSHTQYVRGQPQNFTERNNFDFGLSQIPPQQTFNPHFNPQSSGGVYPNPSQDFNDQFGYIPDPNCHPSHEDDFDPSQPLINTENLDGDDSDNNDKDKGDGDSSTDDDSNKDIDIDEVSPDEDDNRAQAFLQNQSHSGNKGSRINRKTLLYKNNYILRPKSGETAKRGETPTLGFVNCKMSDVIHHEDDTDILADNFFDERDVLEVHRMTNKAPKAPNPQHLKAKATKGNGKQKAKKSLYHDVDSGDESAIGLSDNSIAHVGVSLKKPRARRTYTADSEKQAKNLGYYDKQWRAIIREAQHGWKRYSVVERMDPFPTSANLGEAEQILRRVIAKNLNSGAVLTQVYEQTHEMGQCVFNVLSSWRGNLKKLAAKAVAKAYNREIWHQDDENKDVSNQAAMTAIIRKNIEGLLHKSNFHLYGKDAQGRTCNFAHPAIGQVIQDCFYYPNGSKENPCLASLFPDDFSMTVPDKVVAVSCVFIKACLRDYLGSELKPSSAQADFTRELWLPSFKMYYASIQVLRKDPYHRAKYEADCASWAEQGMRQIQNVDSGDGSEVELRLD